MKKLKGIYPSENGAPTTPAMNYAPEGYSFRIPTLNHFDPETKQLVTNDDLIEKHPDRATYYPNSIHIGFFKTGEDAQCGILDEQLLQILLFRQKMWRDDPNFPSSEANDRIIEHYEAILKILRDRADDRAKRSVRGTYKK